MDKLIVKRVIEEANIIISTETTLRELAKHLGISKSTIHKDMQERLTILDKDLYNKVQAVFQKHIDTRHYIGGEATRKKYQNML